MAEKFNSGYGGYTCDNCSVLLWAGANGKDKSERRIYCYNTKLENIVRVKDKIFCSKKCAVLIKEIKL